MEEIWKDVRGFEGRYQVSNLGRVRSLDWPGHRGRMLKLKICKRWGYYRLNLAHADGYIKFVSVHRLVAIAFIPNPDNLPEVNHKDENKLNNVVCLNPDGSIDTGHTNLEWCTGLYNIRYGTRNERVQKAVNEPRMRAVHQYDFDGNLLHTYKSISDASRKTGVSARSICHICKKTGAHSANGYIFRYTDDNSPWVNFDPNICRGNKEKMRVIEQYDVNGNFIKSYKSQSEAVRVTGIKSLAIWSVLSGKQKTTHGYIFKYGDLKQKGKCSGKSYNTTLRNYNDTNKKQVYQYDADGNYINTYESISAASKATGISTWDISNVCSGRRKISHGYIFKFTE